LRVQGEHGEGHARPKKPPLPLLRRPVVELGGSEELLADGQKAQPLLKRRSPAFQTTPGAVLGMRPEHCQQVGVRVLRGQRLDGPIIVPLRVEMIPAVDIHSLDRIVIEIRHWIGLIQELLISKGSGSWTEATSVISALSSGLRSLMTFRICVSAR
jgi:hypothetical protein